MFEKASAEELAERHRIAVRVREELAIAGLPTVGDDYGMPAEVNGVRVTVDPGDDAVGGVIIQWECSGRLTDRVVDAAANRRVDDSALWHAGTVKKAMNAAVVQILTAAGFTIVDSPNDMNPLSLQVREAPAADMPLAWERAGGPVSPWVSQP